MVEYGSNEPVKGQVEIDGAKIETFAQEIVSANIITVEVGTTGHCGGDSGHGGRTYLRIKDEASTDMRVKTEGFSVDEQLYNEVEINDAKYVEIVFGKTAI